MTYNRTGPHNGNLVSINILTTYTSAKIIWCQCYEEHHKYNVMFL